jgi:hypothetical protein
MGCRRRLKRKYNKEKYNKYSLQMFRSPIRHIYQEHNEFFPRTFSSPRNSSIEIIRDNYINLA